MEKVETSSLFRSVFYFLACFITIVLLLTNITYVHAEEITVSGNGSESSNQASVDNSNNSNVSQNNTADVNNDVNVNSNTGSNQASNNTGGSTQVTTGDSNSNTNIQNNANSSTVQSNCNCSTTGSENQVNISGNGDNSNNTANADLNNQNNITVNQYANITNHISGYTNTGNNKADYNTNGDVSIITGNINVRNQIDNSNVNVSSVNLQTSLAGSFNILITGNGANSTNTVNFNQSNQNNVKVTNNATLNNILNWYANTGNNSASHNTGGNVLISTGNIVIDNIIKNSVNSSDVEVGCGCPTPPTDTPGPSNPPSNNDNGGGGGSSSDSSSGGSSGVGGGVGEVLGAMFPATGIDLLGLTLFALFLLILGLGFMFQSKRISKWFRSLDLSRFADLFSKNVSIFGFVKI